MAIDILSQISPSPTPGRFYTIVYGDTLLGVAGAAFGLGPGAERYDRARLINGAAYNGRFTGKPSNLFPEGQLSFLPKFVGDPNQQASAAGACPSGHSFATLWIPAEAGDEPDLDDGDDPVTPKPKP